MLVKGATGCKLLIPSTVISHRRAVPTLSYHVFFFRLFILAGGWNHVVYDQCFPRIDSLCIRDGRHANSTSVHRLHETWWGNATYFVASIKVRNTDYYGLVDISRYTITRYCTEKSNFEGKTSATPWPYENNPYLDLTGELWVFHASYLEKSDRDISGAHYMTLYCDARYYGAPLLTKTN